ncbi:hypothetical protein AVEN_179567-1 [Araneus ventricosus]|uniref:Uncharacterized protein n=1 Tax=Araneus ventricosus TaxID=182803 RepID=A0A4Y2BE32_ARAVE|nr:hypothetical protein AVEN_179567-1 [Araneus ventricosus]
MTTGKLTYEMEPCSETFPDRWIGRDGPVSGPPRSPDITPLNFSFGGYRKNRVYAAEVRSVEELKIRISTETATVTPQMLNNICREIANRLDTLRATNGGHVEVY